MNLWKETVDILEENNKSWDDVKFIIAKDKLISKEVAATIFKEINYDDGYGHIEINPELKIVGDNWWLERAEYDGSEWWEFKTQPSDVNAEILKDKDEILGLVYRKEDVWW